MNPKIRIEVVSNGLIVDVTDSTGASLGTGVYNFEDMDMFLTDVEELVEMLDEEANSPAIED